LKSFDTANAVSRTQFGQKISDLEFPVSVVEGICVLEVPGRIPAIVSGGKSRRHHAPTKLVVFYPLFPERHLERLVFFTINKTQGPILIFSKWLHKGGPVEVRAAIPAVISPFPAPFSFGLIIMVLGLPT
jgi:hypothetical protein